MIETVSEPLIRRVESRLRMLYGPDITRMMHRYLQLLGRYGVGIKSWRQPQRWSQADSVLITYADMVQSPDEAPLKTLTRFLSQHLSRAFSTVHILPFHPWSSDDGFSVKDYREVNESYGEWRDLRALGEHFSLMFDLVLNHCSRESSWFSSYIRGIMPMRDYFIEGDPHVDHSMVVRPRTSPLFSEVETRNGRRFVWTTFSADQVDLNWSNPDVLFEFLDILLFFLSNGCRMIRLDAVAFLWKELGTTCLHLPQTHEVVKLLRDTLEIVAPDAILITETNVPHEENISYFGEGDETHMVYNFTLPPLLLHALLTGRSSHLTRWAASLPQLPEGCTFLNFTASHDGIGVRPLQGILTPEEIQSLARAMKNRGGEVSFRDTGHGEPSPYELNITYFSALSDPETPDLDIDRFICSQAVAMSMQGIPALYFHSLTASRNDRAGFSATGMKRSINRHKWDEQELTEHLSGEGSEGGKVFQRLIWMLDRRGELPAFHPEAAQRIHDWGDTVFVVERESQGPQAQRLLCLFNFSSRKKRLKCPLLPELFGTVGKVKDVLSDFQVSLQKVSQIELRPYQVLWLVHHPD